LINLENHFWTGILRVKRVKDIIFFILLLCPNLYCGSDHEIDPVIKYYLSGVDSTFNQAFIINAISFDCQVMSILKVTNYRGETDKIDTALYQLYFLGGNLDSISIIDSAGTEKNSLPDNFTPPDIWNQKINFTFYPNDTGAGRLAIGFNRSDSLLSRNSTGFINIDRNRFDLLSLFVHYPFYKEAIRHSKSYKFDYKDGFIRPLIYESNSIEKRFMGQKYFQHRLYFDKYNIH